MKDRALQRRALEDALAGLSADDFSGRTEFARWTSAQRLEWLSSAVQFFYRNAARLPERLRPASEAEKQEWREFYARALRERRGA